jgi:DNA-directed RNA polymerase specialized sigma subunit
MGLKEAYDVWSKDRSNANFLAMLEASRDRQEAAIKSYAGTPDRAMRIQARLLAAQALLKYDPNKGANIDTHLTNALHPLYRYAAKRDLIRVPEGVRQLNYKANAVEAELADELGREPTAQELAHRLGVPVQKLAKIRNNYHFATSESLMTSEEGDPLFAATEVNPRIKAWEDYVYSDLDPTDKKIFEHTRGYAGAPVLGTGEIAKKLGLSPSAISQRITKLGDRLLEGREFYERG